MLLLVFRAGAGRYGLDVRDILEVAACPACLELPQAPPYVLGLLNYRGEAIPVIDISALLTGVRANALLSTRLALARCQHGTETKIVGLVVENAVEIIQCEENEIQPPALSFPGAPCLGGTLPVKDGMIQCVTVARLLPTAVREMLFPAKEAA